MAFVATEGVLAEIDRWLEQGIELRKKLAAAGLNGESSHASFREAVDAALLELNDFSLDELRQHLMGSYPSLAQGSTLNTAVFKAVKKGKLEKLGNKRYKVLEEWRRTQIPAS